MATFGKRIWSQIYPLKKKTFIYPLEGYRVFTEKYHLKRGYCCRSNCRHCPYGFDPRTAG